MPASAPGGAACSPTHGQIDADLDAQLDRVIAELLPDRHSRRAALTYLGLRRLEAVESAMPFRVVGQVQAIGGLDHRGRAI